MNGKEDLKEGSRPELRLSLADIADRSIREVMIEAKASIDGRLRVVEEEMGRARRASVASTKDRSTEVPIKDRSTEVPIEQPGKSSSSRGNAYTANYSSVPY